MKKCLLESLFGGSIPGYFAPFVHGDLMDIWVFADLSRRDFVGKGKQKEVKKKKILPNLKDLSFVEGKCS